MATRQRHTIRTMCPMNCHPTLCGMLVEIEDGRLVQVSGDKDNPDSQGFLCVRGQAAREVIDNPRRLLQPLVRHRRTADAWRQASWDEALALIAAHLRAVGREAVGIWAGHGVLSTNYGTRIGGNLLRRFANFYGWDSEAGVIDALLDHPCTGHTTVAALRAQGGMAALRISHVAYPDRRFHTSSGKVELYSARAQALGLPPLPVYEAPPESPYPLAFCQGRTLTHFHAFYDHGQALPTLARLDPEPCLWMAPTDAAARGIQDGGAIRIYNERGAFQARAQVTAQMPTGTVWMRDGWEGINGLTSGRPVLPDAAVDIFAFSAGQASFDAMVEVVPA